MTNVPAEFEKCRRLGHAWNDVASSDWKPITRAGEEVRCERCGTLRRFTLDAYGEVTARSYEYPEGYSIPKYDTPTRAEMRAARIKRPRGRKAA